MQIQPEAGNLVDESSDQHEDELMKKNILESGSEKSSTMKIIDLDHDSLENILSYCPNRGCYEIQSMKLVCRGWNLLLSGRIYNEYYHQSTPNHLEDSISKTIKEVIRNSDLLSRIEHAYLPRLHFQIYVPLPCDTSSEDEGDVLEPLDLYFEEFTKIFGDSARKISKYEMEVGFEMEESLLENMEQVIDTNVTVPKHDTLQNHLAHRNAMPTDDDQMCKLYHVVKKVEQHDKKIRSHVSLPDLYSNWKNQPLIDKKQRVNPCRLSKKLLLHLSFYNSLESHIHDPKVCRESTIYCTSRRKKGFLFVNTSRDEINTRSGTIRQDFVLQYKFLTNAESIENGTRIIVYYLLRHKLIPRMDEISIDLKQFFSKEILNHVKKLEKEDQYFFLTVRENIIKKYRDGLLNGNVKFQDFTEKQFFFKVDGKIIPQFLTLAALESMDNSQRAQLAKQFFKHIYSSGLSISDEKRQEFFDRFGIDHRETPFTISEDTDLISMTFERIYFKREMATISHHIFTFPSFPNISMVVNEETPEDKCMNELTIAGTIDKCYTATCCMSRVCGMCNCCAILSCWCATSCCCYTAGNNNLVSSTQSLGLPKWIGWLCQGICCFENRILPMLDCANCFDQFYSLKEGNDTMVYRYEKMYKQKN